jgi:RNA polymerase sigma-70 factor (ECF subfamily)
MDAVTPDLVAARVSLARGGDEEAFGQIVAEHHADVLRVCYLVCGSRDLAEDAAQSTWTQVWRHLRTLRDPTRLRAWVLAIAGNEARQLMRRERLRHLFRHQPAASPGIDPARVDLQSALSSLSADDRRLLALRHVAGLSSKEIGELLHISPTAVRMRLTRLHERLRRELRDG